MKFKPAALEDSALSGRARDLDDAVKVLGELGFTRERFSGEYDHLRYDQLYAYSMVMKAAW